jgi:DNA replication protein DnaC
MADDHDETRARFAEHQRAWRLMQEARWALAVPARFMTAAVADFSTVGSRLWEWASAERRSNLVIVGPAGTGKTRAAVAAARVRFDAGDRIGFWPATGLLDAMRPDGTVDFDRVLDADLLVLDDLGAQKSSEWVQERLDRIMDGRWSEERPVVVTSNLTPEQLARWVGERVWSRLQDGAVTVRMSGQDRRRS